MAGSGDQHGWSTSSLHEKCGVGYSSRFRIREGDLPPGWRQVQSSPKCTVWYDDKGKRYRTSLAVERAIREQGFLTDVSETETEAETGGETSEFEPSPVKRPRTSEV